MSTNPASSRSRGPSGLPPLIRPIDVRLYSIVYSAETEAQRDPDTLMLDNRENARPDWREYSPIRDYLLANKLKQNMYYGFFSPKFPWKTGLSGAGITEFITSHRSDIDVFTFSPQADLGAFFLNVFEQGETFDAGFMEASELAASALGFQTDLRSLVMDSRHVVFSNFIVAKKAFWKRWLELCERIFDVCERGEGPLARGLSQGTNYPGGVARKVFLIERIASLMLKIEPWKVQPYDTFKCAWSSLPTASFRHEAILSDALKLAHNELGGEHYLNAFGQLRQQVFFTRK